ncbi:glycosyltransferase family 2 protein, partial [Candidatus Saccharibacteria bacterium]|nr:glycosyltransferase family 2 protein [Candidatus Saccharibacteria bacterium]
MISLSVMKTKIAVVIPNWNGKDVIKSCLDSLLSQKAEAKIVVVENASIDGSLEFVKNNYPDVVVLEQGKNLGFAGGVNMGIKYAMKNDYEFVALFNNDAVADKNWLGYLIKELEENSETGIATCKFLTTDGEKIDSTGDLYTSWGLPFPRGRDEKEDGQYDAKNEVFAATGGASLYRLSMLEQIGLFDEDFFAYFEDVDISFRAQLAGWKVRYVPKAIAYHKIGATSGKISGFTTFQTLKNLPWVYWKNVPLSIAIPMFPKIFIVYWAIFVRAILRGEIFIAIKATIICHVFIPKKLFYQRFKIMRLKRVGNNYIKSIIYKGPPPNAKK